MTKRYLELLLLLNDQITHHQSQAGAEGADDEKLSFQPACLCRFVHNSLLIISRYAQLQVFDLQYVLPLSLHLLISIYDIEKILALILAIWSGTAIKILFEASLSPKVCRTYIPK